MGVDFVQSDGGKDKPKQSGYDIEYTNPAGDTSPTPPKTKHGNLLGFFHKTEPNPYTKLPPKKPVASAPQTAVSAQAPTGRSVRAVHELPQQLSQPVQPIRTTPAVINQPKTAALPERHIPPAPPPPVHAQSVVTKPITSQPVVASVAPPRPTPPPPPPSQPVTPAPAPVRPVQQVTPIQSAGPVGTPVAAAAHHATSVGQIIAQNVSGMRGETTNPAAPHPGVLNLNLLPNALHKSLHQTSALFRLFRTATLTLMALTAIYLALVCYQAFFVWRTHTALAELQTLDTTILGYRTLQTDINTTSDTLTAIQQLLDEHVYWTQWFAFLEQHTLSTVYYTNFSGSTTGMMSLEAVAPDFSTIAQQLAVWQALSEVESVQVTTATRTGSTDSAESGQGGVYFTMSVQVNPSLLQFQPRGIYGQ